MHLKTRQQGWQARKQAIYRDNPHPPCMLASVIWPKQLVVGDLLDVTLQSLASKEVTSRDGLVPLPGTTLTKHLELHLKIN